VHNLRYGRPSLIVVKGKEIEREEREEVEEVQEVQERCLVDLDAEVRFACLGDPEAGGIQRWRAQLSANWEAQRLSFQIATAVVLLPQPLRHGSSNRAGVTVADRY
jgi:hypothetical protein